MIRGNKAIRSGLAIGVTMAAGAARADPPQLTQGPTIPAIPGQVINFPPRLTVPGGLVITGDSPGGASASPSILISSERNLTITLSALDTATLDALLGYSSVAQTASPATCDVVQNSGVGAGGNYVPELGGCYADGTDFATSAGYSLTETRIVTATQVNGSVTATVRLAGTGQLLATATAASGATAEAQALAAASLATLPGRVLPPSQASSVTQTITDSDNRVLTGRDVYVWVQTVIGAAVANVGQTGRCDHPNGTCEGGVPTYLVSGAVLINTGVFTDLYVTDTVSRTITTNGTVTLTIPLAAAGYVHPSAQTIAFDLSDRFLARLRDAATAPWRRSERTGACTCSSKARAAAWIMTAADACRARTAASSAHAAAWYSAPDRA